MGPGGGQVQPTHVLIPIPMLSYPRARARGTGMGTEQPIMSPLGGS